MGEHKLAQTIKIVKFLEEFGNCLGYVVQNEDSMFPGQKTSPIMDLTWRRNSEQRYPIFIFEINSSPEKSASDNAIKVLSKPTEKFQKPLFFFYVFIKQKNETDRIDALKSQYNNTNYDVYLLSVPNSACRLLSDMLEQHFRIDISLNLNS